MLFLSDIFKFIMKWIGIRLFLFHCLDTQNILSIWIFMTVLSSHLSPPFSSPGAPTRCILELLNPSPCLSKAAHAYFQVHLSLHPAPVCCMLSMLYLRNAFQICDMLFHCIELILYFEILFLFNYYIPQSQNFKIDSCPYLPILVWFLHFVS